MSIASAQSTLDDSQVSSVLYAGIAEAHRFGLHASEEEYRERLSGVQRQLSDDPTGSGGRSRGLVDRLAAGLVECQPDSGCRYGLMSLRERVSG